jgi:hypothetical protein
MDGNVQRSAGKVAICLTRLGQSITRQPRLFRLQTEFVSDVGVTHGIQKSAILGKLAQRRQPRLREEGSRHAPVRFDLYQTAGHHGLDRGRKLRLAGQRPSTPDTQEHALCYRGEATEVLTEFTPNDVALRRCKGINGRRGMDDHRLAYHGWPRRKGPLDLHIGDDWLACTQHRARRLRHASPWQRIHMVDFSAAIDSANSSGCTDIAIGVRRGDG